ncbi:MAG: hypothetical protein ACK49N_04735 [Verrucomicrobiota bacterium]|jgi:hypothetical protein
MAYHLMTPRFPLGQTVATPGAIALQIDLGAFLHRHHCGDWGDLDDCDKRMNEDALKEGDRILSHYKLDDGRRIYIITESDRSSTCVLLPEEY